MPGPYCGSADMSRLFPCALMQCRTSMSSLQMIRPLATILLPDINCFTRHPSVIPRLSHPTRVKVLNRTATNKTTIIDPALQRLWNESQRIPLSLPTFTDHQHVRFESASTDNNCTTKQSCDRSSSTGNGSNAESEGRFP